MYLEKCLCTGDDSTAAQVRKTLNREAEQTQRDSREGDHCFTIDVTAVPHHQVYSLQEVRSLQSQFHNVSGRSASGDRMILQLSSMSDVSGIKTVLLSAKQSGIVLPPIRLDKHERGTSNQFHQHICRRRREFRQDQSRVFLQSKEFIKVSLMNSLIDVIRSLLNILQNIFVLVIPRAFFACLENGSPILTKSSSRFIFIFQGVALFICNSTGRKHGFLVTPGTLSTSASG